MAALLLALDGRQPATQRRRSWQRPVGELANRQTHTNAHTPHTSSTSGLTYQDRAASCVRGSRWSTPRIVRATQSASRTNTTKLFVCWWLCRAPTKLGFGEVFRTWTANVCSRAVFGFVPVCGEGLMSWGSPDHQVQQNMLQGQGLAEGRQHGVQGIGSPMVRPSLLQCQVHGWLPQGEGQGQGQGKGHGQVRWQVSMAATARTTRTTTRRSTRRTTNLRTNKLVVVVVLELWRSRVFCELYGSRTHNKRLVPVTSVWVLGGGCSSAVVAS